MRRIVVTGMGAVSPLGCGVETNWSRLIAGRSGIRTLPEAITADLSAKVGGQVPDVAVDPEGGFDPDRAAPRKDQLEAIFAILALRDQIAPETLNLDNPDPSSEGMDLVRGSARAMKIDHVLSNGFGFGGVNASVVLRKM